MSEKKARVRYYDESQHEAADNPDETGKIRFELDQSGEGDKSELANVENNFSPCLEEKRKRLLRKVELAKQVGIRDIYSRTAKSGLVRFSESWLCLRSERIRLDC